MAEIDDRLIRYVKRMAGRFYAKGIGRDDLAQAAFLALVREGVPERLDHAMQVAKRAMSHYLKRETKAGRRGRLSRVMAPLDDPTELVSPEYPEPLPGTVALMGRLTDNECQAVTLACGLDGAPERSSGEAAWIMGRQRQTVHRWRRSGLAKLAAR